MCYVSQGSQAVLGGDANNPDITQKKVIFNNCVEYCNNGIIALFFYTRFGLGQVQGYKLHLNIVSNVLFNKLCQNNDLKLVL